MGNLDISTVGHDEHSAEHGLESAGLTNAGYFGAAEGIGITQFLMSSKFIDSDGNGLLNRTASAAKGDGSRTMISNAFGAGGALAFSLSASRRSRRSRNPGGVICLKIQPMLRMQNAAGGRA